MNINPITIYKYLKIYKTIKNSGLFDSKYYLFTYPDIRTQDIDPIKHYILYGVKEGRNPSLDFNTVSYLNKYDDVKKKGINPFFHYITYGHKEKRLSYMQEEITMNIAEVKKEEETKVGNEQKLIDIYISCWLGGKESLHDGLIYLAQSLKAKGHRVVFITQSDNFLNSSEIKTINSNLFLYGTENYTSAYRMETPDELHRELYSIMKLRPFLQNTIDLEKQKRELNALIENAYGYWYQQFVNTDPSMILIWGSSCEISRLHIYLCKKLNIPYLVIERGHFPKSISVETIGQFGYGGSHMLVEKNGLNKNLYQQIKNWIEQLDEMPYQHKNISKSIHPSIESARLKGQKIVLFIGVNDLGSGIAYTESVNERHGNLFHSSKDAFIATLNALKIVDPNALLVFKPHPGDTTDYAVYQNEKIIIEKDMNINNLIKLTDVCVTMSTTAIAQCIIEEKPLVIMSLTDINGYGIAYECTDFSTVAMNLRSAINKENFDTKILEGKKFIQRLFSRNLYTIEKKSSIMPTIKQLSEKLSKRMQMFFPINRFDLISLSENNTLPICEYKNFSINDSDSICSAIQNQVDVIMPIYSDASITKQAIESAIASKAEEDFRLILINDASPQQEIYDLLESYKKKENKNIFVYTNKTNLGFSGTVNRGIELAGTNDVIILNSDAIVPFGFVDRMKKSAYSHYKIATVTPFSNNAGIHSVPSIKGEDLSIDNAHTIVMHRDNQAQQKNSNFTSVEMPIGHGFCMYIRRSILDHIGCFDELTFGRGYSEEIDFCLRARKAGFYNTLAPNVFVGHIGAVSFAEDANELRNKNREIIRKKFPSYFDEISTIINNDPIRSFRLTNKEQNE